VINATLGATVALVVLLGALFGPLAVGALALVLIIATSYEARAAWRRGFFRS